MALTDTKASKTFVAGAPDIILKGDYRREKPEMKMASDPDIMDERNELSLRLFGKELKLLTPEELDLLNEEAERLMQKYSLKQKEAPSIKLAGGGLAYLMGM